MDLSTQQELDSDPKAILQISSTGNLEKDGNTFFITETIFNFPTEL